MNRIVKPGFFSRLASPQLPHWSVAPNVNHYQVLGVGRQANNREIDLAFFALAAVWHPTVCRRSGGAEVFERIAVAHKVLIDPRARYKYDLTLSPAVRVPQPSHPAVAAYQRMGAPSSPQSPASIRHYA
jgi:DnaJ-class molecular chaperone